MFAFIKFYAHGPAAGLFKWGDKWIPDTMDNRDRIQIERMLRSRPPIAEIVTVGADGKSVIS